MKWLFAVFTFFLSAIASAQPNNILTVESPSMVLWKNIDRIDYTLQCPIDWKIDSTSTELKIRPIEASDNSITVYVYSFKTAVVPFKTFIKNPPVDFDAKTTISQNKNPDIYTVTSTKRCASCIAFTNQVKEQHYSVANKKVYILYYVATDIALEKYQNNLTIISNSFIPKK